MKIKIEKEQQMLILTAIACAAVLTYGTGCAALGVKKFDAWGLGWENFAGTDLHAGFNNIDKVDDRRGVGEVEKLGRN